MKRIAKPEKSKDTKIQLILFGFERSAQFQVLSGDLGKVPNKHRDKIRNLASEGAKLSANSNFPIGMYNTLGSGQCYIVSIPTRVREAHSGRKGISVVLAIYIYNSVPLDTRQLLCALRSAEFCLSSAMEKNFLNLSEAAEELGFRLQSGLMHDHRTHIKDLFVATSRMLSHTLYAKSFFNSQPRDLLCTNIMATLSAGQQVKNRKQFSTFIPFGMTPPAIEHVISCQHVMDGFYFSATLSKDRSTNAFSTAPPSASAFDKANLKGSPNDALGPRW